MMNVTVKQKEQVSSGKWAATPCQRCPDGLIVDSKAKLPGPMTVHFRLR